MNFCVGDLHGRAAAFEEVLKKCNFDFKNDTLISLGDICDGGRETKRCFEILDNNKDVSLV
jgi:Icc-related predicted phosphoesterase